MGDKVINVIILSIFLVLIRLSDVGVEGAKEQIIKRYINEHPEYGQVLQSFEYRERNLKPKQKEVFISGGEEVGRRLFYLKIVEWGVVALLVLVFSFVFGRTDRSGKRVS